MDKARIYVDYNEMLDHNTVLLSKEDTKIDSKGNIITFYEGMPISVYSDDISDNEEADNLIAEGIVKYVLPQGVLCELVLEIATDEISGGVK